MQTPETRKIAICVSHDMSLVCALMACEPFRSANRVSGEPLYDVVFIHAAEAPVKSAIGISVTPDEVFSDGTRFDLVILVASYEQDETFKKRLFSWLRKQDRFGANLCGVDYGAYLLAEAGLLDGYRASPHWEHVPSMHESFPRVNSTDAVYVIDRDRLTCGGYVSSIDLFLAVIRDDFDKRLMQLVATDLYLGPVRDSKSRQDASMAKETFVYNSKVNQAIELMHKNIEEPLSVKELAAEVGISVRQLQGLFVQHTRETPSERYLDLRLLKACQILMYSDLPVLSIATATGFSSVSIFCRAFRRRYGKTAGTYRRDFQTGHSRMIGKAFQIEP